MPNKIHSKAPTFDTMNPSSTNDMSQIQQFYVGQNVLITGATGFLGKILTEKLLRSCPEIGTIYLLVRSKKGKEMQERVDQLLSEPVFNLLKKEFPEFKNKVVGIFGDITMDGLGLAPSDRTLLTKEVSVIFHVAATVRFDEKLDLAVAINVNSVKDIVDLSEECKQLKVAVYVSTAFSNCVLDEVDEQFYSTPLNHEDVNQIVNIARKRNWSEEMLHDFAVKIMGKWPNTYTFTKAIGENVIAEFAKDMPYAVFRPSIVLSSRKEPVAGWCDNAMGVNGVVAGVGAGVLHAMLLEKKAKCDMVPVDMACNALIACAWETAVTNRGADEQIPVYNYVSGPENPITWNSFIEYCHKCGKETPSNAAVYYMCVIYTGSRLLFGICEFFFHLVPALIIDNCLRLFGREPVMYKVYLRVANLVRVLAFFTLNQWTFQNQRIQNLWKRLGGKDKQIFPFSMKSFEWSEHLTVHVLGVRKYILKDVDGEEHIARRRQFFLHIIHTVIQLAFASLILWVIWKIFSAQGTAIQTLTAAII